MKNIESIIKYLSGEMLPEEKEQFMKEVQGNKDLRSELEAVSSIWNEIKDQLTLRHAPDPKEREEFIAEILAEHDIQFYKQEEAREEEQEFRKKLEEAMKEAPAPRRTFKGMNPRLISMISMAAAAAIIAFVLILNPPPDLYELAEQYYQPESDAVFKTLSNTSRSGSGSAMALFRHGDFKEAQSISFSEMQKNPEIGEFRLLYALSCYELGDQKTAVANLNAITLRFEGNINESARWYLALIKISDDMTQEASLILQELIADQSSYEKQAQKILRKIEKQVD